MLIEQSHTKPQGTLEFKTIKQRETYHFNPPVEVKEYCMIGLTDLQVCNSIINITKGNNKFKLYEFPNEKVVVFHLKKSKMKLKKVCIIQIIQLPIYKMIF